MKNKENIRDPFSDVVGLITTSKILWFSSDNGMLAWSYELWV